MTLQKKLYFAVQSRFHRDNSGAVRTDHGFARYEAWLPYLSGVNEVVLVARVSGEVRDTGSGVEGPGVSVLAVPFYHGPIDFLRNYYKLRRFVASSLNDPEAVYGARIPDILGAMVQQQARRLRAVFIAQLVGDPEEVLNAGAAGELGRRLSRVARWVVARQVRRASAVIYVTRQTLQSKYPAQANAPTLVRSNVELGKSSFGTSHRDYRIREKAADLRVVAVGSHEQRYKGHDTLLEAIAILRRQGVGVHATIIGDGKFHSALVDKSKTLGIEASVTFTGHLKSAEQVREHLVSSDIFAMPSTTEGLPRALIEAMAVGIVCVGSRVGGIPELLPDQCLFGHSKPNELAEVIARLSESPHLMTQLAASNWREARNIADHYSGDALLQDFMSVIVGSATRT